MEGMWQDVLDFSRKFGLPVYPEAPPAVLKPDVFVFRNKFIHEEADEFYLAHMDNDLAGAVDALVDLCYVALGTAALMGVPFDEHWRAVQAANMLKERAEAANDGRSKRGHAFDIVKPDGWRAPDHVPILGRAQKAYADRRLAHLSKVPREP